MNKAFLREPDEPEPRCPACGSVGQSVPASTLAHHVPPQLAKLHPTGASYCANPRCLVAYFDAAGSTIGVELLRLPLWPKVPDAPVCRCLNLSVQDIERDAQHNDPTRIKKLLAYAQSPQARCHELSPTGRPCIAEAQRLYLKHRRS